MPDHDFIALPDLMSAINYLTKDEKYEFLQTRILESPDEGDFRACAHHTLGMWIRNNFGLWFTPQESPLVQWFWDRGLTHADDMSGIILSALYRHARGQELNWMDIQAQIEG